MRRNSSRHVLGNLPSPMRSAAAPTDHRPPSSEPGASDSSEGVAIRLSDVQKTYGSGPGATHALRGVTAALTTGSMTAIVGASGSGKSTLLNCAAGLESPTRGQVVIGRHDISTLDPDQLTVFRRDHVGFVFQAYNLLDHVSVAENIALPSMLAGRAVEPAWRDHLVESTGLIGLLERRPAELSGGQAQRVAIARALVTRPTVVFADEPTGALDSRTGEVVLDLLRTTARDLGQTVVVVTHDSRVAAAADEVLVLTDGLVADRLRAPDAETVNARVLAAAR